LLFSKNTEAARRIRTSIIDFSYQGVNAGKEIVVLVLIVI
jgi:hypothetical protein